MEKTLGNRFSYLRTYDQNPVHTKATHPKNRRSQAKRTRPRKKRTVTQVPSISSKKTTVNRIVKNDPSLLGQPPTKTTSNYRHERINYQLRGNHGRVQY